MELSNSLVLLITAVSGWVFLGWFVFSRTRTLLQEKKADQALLLLQQQLEQLGVQFRDGLDHSARSIQGQLAQVLGHVNERLRDNADVLQKTQQSLGERLDNAARVVSQVERSLGGLAEANRRIYEIARDIASLQEILRAPKLRGGLGEFFLGDLLAQILPLQHFAMQHAFRNGDKVDAVIKLGPSLVPVDAKFPLENFRRMLEAGADEEKNRARKQFIADVKKHIDAIAAKYILPDEGTYDFALMYVPAENVYYETIIKDDASDEKSLSHYALGRRVIPVSPNSFYAYLQAIVLGLRGMNIEDRTREILEYLSRLQGDFGKFREDFVLIGKHLSHAQSCYQSADRRLEQFAQKLLTADADQKELCQKTSGSGAR